MKICKDAETPKVLLCGQNGLFVGDDLDASASNTLPRELPVRERKLSIDDFIFLACCKTHFVAFELRVEG